MYWASDSAQPHGISALTFYSPIVKSRAYVGGVDGVAQGASYGYFPLAGIASIAEYVERKHLLARVPIHGRKQLSAFQPEMPSLLTAIVQTGGRGVAAGDPNVDVTGAFRYADWCPVGVPRSLVSLGADTSEGGRLIPQSDSSGAAAHVTADAAVASSVLEFIERQTWVAYWLGGGKAIQIAIEVQECGECFTHLRDAPGEFTFFHLCAGLPGYTVLCLYREQGATVQYCFACGLAASLVPGDALKKSLIEADHYRQFAREKAESQENYPTTVGRLERNALRFQKRDSHDFLWQRNLSSRKRSAEEFFEQTSHTLESAKIRLLSVSSEIFVYLAHDESTLGDFFVSRVFSPAFYLHCDPGVSLNFCNSYATSLGIADPDASFRTSTCLP